MNPNYYWVALGVAVALILHFKPWKYLKKAKTPEWVKKHFAWTIVLIVAAIILIPTFLAEIVDFGSFVLSAMMAGPAKVFLGTDRSEWGVTSKPTPHSMYTHSVGGPIRWNSNAKVKLRDRVCLEHVDSNGVCFAGIIPPGSYTKATYVAYVEGGMDWNPFLVDFTSSGSFLPPTTLMQRGGTRHGKPIGIVSMPDLASQGRHTSTFHNETNSSSPQILECYIQGVGQGPSAVHVTHQDQRNTFQYVVEVGAHETSFAIPQEAWKQLWVAPVHVRCYQSRFLRTVIPAEGIDLDEASRIVSTSETELKESLLPLITKGDGYQHDAEFQALIMKRNGETAPLRKAVLLRREDVDGGLISLRLNVPTNEELSVAIQPMRVIVGIQM